MRERNAAPASGGLGSRTATELDAEARERALDPTGSFLVQAPAGSGKTELLIQRYLALLAHVERPEQIVAMTFTRKSAGEMRERVIAALTDAVVGIPVDSTHKRRTRALALAVLEADRRHRWELVHHPARLAVFTIDAFAAGLARQVPLATGLGGAPRYEEHAEPQYIAAARAALAAVDGHNTAWRRLLAHVDNDAGEAIRLIAGMLAKREQWIGELAAGDRARFRAVLEATLTAEIEGELAAVAALLPRSLVAALAAHERYAAACLAGDAEAQELAAALAACAAAGGIPAASASEQPHWAAFANWLLLKREPRFQATVSVKRGFPAARAGSANAARNDAMRTLQSDLASVPGLADGLHAVRRLPSPRYDDETWSFIEALLEVLPRVAAELTLTFRAAGKVDFTQGTLAALEALGDADAPSDLLLKLDYRIAHLLVDEFQDTSYVQLDLIRRLTAGWQPGDGRTLFAVGDPMQSIYRFRGAEVRLFVEAQASHRIGDVPVVSLVLARNFRAHPDLVDWTNRMFPGVLGPASDPWRGIVGFVPAAAACDPSPESAFTCDVYADEASEARAVVRQVEDALAEGSESVAILVRARMHLDALLPALRAAAIPYAAVELDVLGERQGVQDLVSLAHALIQPADRLAWLAVLRAPWCGLTLPDLLVVAAAADAQHGGPVATLMQQTAPLAGLSLDGSERLSRVAAVLAPALDARGRAGVSTRVRGAWLALGGGATLTESIDLEAAERFFALLDDYDVAGDVPDWPGLAAELAWLHAEPDPRVSTRTQVMTLHRAKGLEFDTVILPCLARPPNRGAPEILRWRRRPRGLLVASMKARGGESDPIYSYLRRLAEVEEGAELGRLLYVGATRAKRRLHLTAVLPREEEDGAWSWLAPPAGSALDKFWPVLGAGIAPPRGAIPEIADAPEARVLNRLPAAWSNPPVQPGVPARAWLSPSRETVPFDWAREAARHVGTVAHRVIAQIATEGPSQWIALRVASLAPRLRAELAAAGVDEGELQASVTAVIDSVNALLADPRGQWLLDPRHAEAASEWALGGWDGNSVTHIAVDRTFVTNGVRWIVDFKTGSHEGADREGFLDREKARYREQLEQYAALVRRLDPRPIRLGLYHPLLRGWREWAYEG
jgi:ATP-dependent exoDNAse (exonuclease V) beta subunit